MPYKDPEKRKAHSRAYYAANREKNRAQSRAWKKANPNYNKIYYQANKEREKARQKAYRIANIEKIKIWRAGHYKQEEACRKARYAANPEKQKAQVKAWQQANREKEKLRHQAYHKANPEKGREHLRMRRALKYKTQIEVINEKLVFMRDGWVCQICHKRVNKRLKWPDAMSLSLDHIIPLNEGGTHTYNNVQLAHLSCNVTKNVNILPQGEQLRIF